MNKSALKNFATKSRTELIERVQLQARKIGITENNIEEATIESSDAIYVDGRQLSDLERKQRNKLIERIAEIGFDRVIEETAYTWFNRFVALRFMEVNDYLPTKVRVLSSDRGKTEPDMLEEALSLDLNIDKEYVYDLKMANETDELFKYLITIHCNDLNRYLPFMFKTLEDYMLILFPEGLLGTESFLRKLINTNVIPEQNWENIEIIGWLYQFYIADEKERVFKANKKYKPEEIPFATQLFTPEWIVRYMVQNSLGRYWVENNPENKRLLTNWEFYINHSEFQQEKIVPTLNGGLAVEDIKCLDPAMGSGHILVYMFDVLYEIYRENGYIEREIPRLIIENNLYGLDIDDRAYQLASFSVVMKALQYNRRFLRSIERDGLQLNLASIQETNNLTTEDIAFLAGEKAGPTFLKLTAFFDQFKDAKSIGSLVKVETETLQIAQDRFIKTKEIAEADLFNYEKRERLFAVLPQLIKQAKLLTEKYHIVVTNPPYMGLRGMNKQLSTYLRKHYEHSRADLFAAFMELDHLTVENGFYAAINQHSWMFLTSYEKLREKVVTTKFIDTMLHLGPRAFEEIGGEVVQSTAFVLRNTQIVNGAGTYIRLIDEKTSEEKRLKTIKAIENPDVQYRYEFNQDNFGKILRSPIAYWLSNKVYEMYDTGNLLMDIAEPKVGMQTSNNSKYLRLWHEIDYREFSKETGDKKWLKYLKGGPYRKWYGNLDYLLFYNNSPQFILKQRNASVLSEDFLTKNKCTWTDLTSGNNSFRYAPQDTFYDISGHCFFPNESDQFWLLGYSNTKLFSHMLKALNSTLHCQVGDVGRIAVPKLTTENKNIVTELSKRNVSISKNDWDSFETSWDFTKHPFLKFPANTIEQSFNDWAKFAEEQFNELKENEEELNRIFIDVYGLQDELTPEVADGDVTVYKADLERDVKSFISYAVGCMFGRYSLDEEGLVFAGGEFDQSRYKTFAVDENNILPILMDSYFEDDIVARFISFVEKVYGPETLTENLDFLAEAIGKRRNETSRETIRRYFLRDFYKDHGRTYKRHPIYWLFSSGRERAFNCLIYMHRYDETTLARIRTDYLHRVQTRYEVEREDLLAIINSDATAKEIRDAKRNLTAIERKIDELKKYDEKLHHFADKQITINLDDGVKVNYDKFKQLVAKL